MKELSSLGPLENKKDNEENLCHGYGKHRDTFYPAISFLLLSI